jgi:hypothetical protein
VGTLRFAHLMDSSDAFLLMQPEHAVDGAQFGGLD